MKTPHNVTVITLGTKTLEVMATSFRIRGGSVCSYGLDRVAPANRATVAAAMAKSAALDAVDPAVIAFEAEQHAVDEAYESEDRTYKAMGY